MTPSGTWEPTLAAGVVVRERRCDEPADRREAIERAQPRLLGVDDLEAFEHRLQLRVEVDADRRQVAAEEALVAGEP